MKKFTFILLLGIVLFVPGCKQGESIEPQPQGEIKGRLMTDEEMVNTGDPLAPDVQADWREWIKGNVNPLRSLTYGGDFSDLQFLKIALAGRSIVQLGESGHGVMEFNKVKVRLIKFMHEEMGFDVIAFESCIFTCFQADRNTAGTADDMMTESIYGVWRTEELMKLFNYIKETQKTNNPLILAGFDMKSSSYTSTIKRPQFLRDMIKAIDETYAEEVYQHDQTILNDLNSRSYDEQETYYTENEATLKESYGKILSFLDLHMEDLLNGFPDDRRSVLVARQTVWSFIRNIEFRVAYAKNTNQTTFLRDSAMAENLACLVNKIHPDKKIMVWAHNFHIRHRQVDISNIKTMGHWLVDQFRPQIYTIGLYMYRGQAAWNTGEIYTVVQHNKDSLEAIGYHAGLKHFFVDMINQDQVPGNSWMVNPIESRSWGTYSLFSVLKDQYDGIIYIDTVHPPDYR